MNVHTYTFPATLFTYRICLYIFSKYINKDQNNSSSEILWRDDISLSANQCHCTTCARYVTSDDDEKLRWVTCVAHELKVSNIINELNNYY